MGGILGATIGSFRAASGLTVTGGTLTSDSTYYYRAFNSSGTLTVSGGTLTADILLVGGGGGGGTGRTINYGGEGEGEGEGEGPAADHMLGSGGGAGGVRYLANQNINSGNYSAVIGAGDPGHYWIQGQTGGGSTSLGTNPNWQASGGMSGITENNAQNGSGLSSSGGGNAYSGAVGTAWARGSNEPYGGSPLPAGTSANSGGYPIARDGVAIKEIYPFDFISRPAASGGGGGAGSRGGDSAIYNIGQTPVAGAGGAGISYFGTMYGGGGGGVAVFGSLSPASPGAGGSGIGGSGGAENSNGQNATANRGSGGGAGGVDTIGFVDTFGGNGSSGRIVVRYLRSAVGG